MKNCHPHVSSDQHEFVVIHNGIVTNYKDIRVKLENSGYLFDSETDTEVIAKLCLYIFRESKKLERPIDFKEVVKRAGHVIEGASAIIVQSSLFPNELCAFKRGSPLILGINESEQDISQESDNCVQYTKEGESGIVQYFLTSDVNALLDHTRRVMYLEDNDVLYFNKEGRFSFHGNEKDRFRVREPSTLEVELSTISKGDFDHFMLKEIYDQTESVHNTMRGRVNFDQKSVYIGGFKNYLESMKHSRRLLFIACGTSYHAALSARPFLEEMTNLPVYIEIASDFMDRKSPVFRDDTCFFVSQSGETADTLLVLDYCKKKGSLCVGITNTVGSTLARATDCGIHLNAGPEVGVASTKCHTSQIIALIMIGLQLGQDRISTREKRHAIINDMQHLRDTIKEVLQLEKKMMDLAKRLVHVPNILILGRGCHYATCLEAALKIKEISYIHTEGLLAGELKHGPLALVDESASIIVIATKDHLHTKILNSIDLLRSRDANPIILCSKGDDIARTVKDAIEVPTVSEALQPIVNIIPFQLLSYHISLLKGINVDRPRNLAKSVTVE